MGYPGKSVSFCLAFLFQIRSSSDFPHDQKQMGKVKKERENSRKKDEMKEETKEESKKDEWTKKECMSEWRSGGINK